VRYAHIRKLAERLWGDALGLYWGEKQDFSGRFQRPNLAMWEILGQISQQALIQKSKK
jgi:hypothetical protein